MQNLDIKKTLDWAEQNQEDPIARSFIDNYKKGIYNTQLKEAGMQPIKVSTPPVDVQKKSILKETTEDVGETFSSVWGQMKSAGDDIRSTFGREDRTAAQKASMIGGRLFGGVSAVLGEAFIGAGKLALNQNQEDKIKNVVQSAGERVADTEVARGLSEWYLGLSPIQQEQVQAAGGYAALLAELVGIRTSSAAVKTAKETIGQVTDTAGVSARQIDQVEIPRVEDDVVMQDPVIQPDVMNSQMILENQVNQAFSRGVKPLLGTQRTAADTRRYNQAVIGATKSIIRGKDDLKFTDPETGEIQTGRAPETLAEYTQAIEQTKANLFRQYDELAQQAGQKGLTIDLTRTGNSLNELINNDALSLSNPEAVMYAREVQNRFTSKGEIDAVNAQQVIQNYNNSLNSFYKNPTPEGLTKASVDAFVVNQLRSSLDEGIEELAGSNYQQLKNEYGNIKTIEKDVLRASEKDARRNQAGLIDFTDIFTVGQLVTNITSPANALGAGASFGLKQWYKYLNDPNTQIKRLFNKAEDLDIEDGDAVGPTQQFLPEGSPDNGISIYTPIETGGMTPRGRVEPGLTERVREGSVQPPTGERTPTNLEQILREDREAVQQAVSEMEADLSGDTRPSIGENFVQTADGGAYRFNELPNWIPDGFRDAGLMTRVLRNVSEGKAPRANAGREIELQKIVEDRIAARADEIRQSDGSKGVFSGDTAFAVALMAGGTYYVVAEDGSLLPVVGATALMANPVTRTASVNQIRRHIDDLAKKIKEAENAGDTKSRTYKNLINAHDKAQEQRLKLETSGKAKGETPQTTLLEEAKKYDSADEFVKSQGQTIYHTTGAKFDKFDDTFKGSNTGDVAQNTDQGFFFAESLKDIEDFKKTLGKGVVDFRGNKLEPKDTSKYRIIEMVLPEGKTMILNPSNIQKMSIKDAEILSKIFGTEDGSVYKGARAKQHVEEVFDEMGIGELDEFMSDNLDYLVEELKDAGYLGIKTNFGGGVDELVIFEPNKLQTKSQLEDIWNQANK